jgi:hypothetical protein
LANALASGNRAEILGAIAEVEAAQTALTGTLDRAVPAAAEQREPRR